MAVPAQRPKGPDGGQAGISLVEIVVAMFILALMSMAVLPLMIGSVQASATNRDVVAATSLAEARLAKLRAAFPDSSANSCEEVAAAAKAIDPSDASVSGTTAPVTPGVCSSNPADYPGVLPVKVEAFRPGSANPVVVLESAILVSSQW